MRAPFIAVSPILTEIQAAYGLSNVSASLLTTLPVLCFGILALLTPRLARRYGTDRTMLVALVFIAVGVLVRSYFGAGGLFTGTVVLGTAIAIANVLLPGLIKRDWSHRAGPLMSVYSVSVALGPAVAALLAVPLLEVLGGNVTLALLVWIASPLAAVFMFQLLRSRMPRAAASGVGPVSGAPAAGQLLKEPLAWQVSAFLGLQSLIFYAVSAWLPTLLVQLGLTPVAAGVGFSAFNLASIAGSISGPLLATRFRQQSGLAVFGAALWTVGLTGLLFAPQAGILMWVSIAGVASGLSFSLALTLIVLRAADAAGAARLSGMAQAVGYLLAAAGPFVLGWLLEVSGGPRLPLFALLGIVPLLALAGLGAGRPLTVLAGTAVTGNRGPLPDTQEAED